GMVLLGEPGHSIEDITLSNISYTSTGGGETEWTDPADFPELTGQRPEFMAFKRIPSYGLFANHVRGLRVCNVRLNCLIPDSRHSMAFFHAENVILDNVDCADGGKMLLHNSDQVRFK
ncbi:MAG: glycoside hydrolase, partial [Bacilli bacterium]|nr:glycoside hydrolase [Bacilli bacterium]